MFTVRVGESRQLDSGQNQLIKYEYYITIHFNLDNNVSYIYKNAAVI